MVVRFAEDTSAGVEVRACRDSERLRIDVEDTGLGVSEEQRERVLGEFARVEQSEQNRVGTGLGLPIVKRLVEALGGEIALASIEGFGSTFMVWLPLGEISLPETIQQKQAPAGRK